MSRRRFKRAKRRRRRRSLSASVWGPILKLLAVILVFLALLYAIFYVVILQMDKKNISSKAPRL